METARLNHPFLSSIMSALAYAPIPLFAESLRVQRAATMSILSQACVPPVLTGCVKDLHKLWDIEDVSLLGNFEGDEAASVTSLRHGSNFQLCNKAVLTLCRVVGRKEDRALRNTKQSPKGREVVVNVSFITPQAGAAKSYGRLVRVCRIVTMIEQVLLLGVCFLLASRALVIGTIISACMTINVSIMFALREFTRPVFGNSEANEEDSRKTARGGASLDVHVVASNWNSSRLDALCGYSKHLHSLTNIPIRVNRPQFLSWASRLLAIVLVVQAAALASLIGNSTEIWSSLAWLLLYGLMLLPSAVMQYFQLQPLLEGYGWNVSVVPAIVFSSRRAALTFIQMLPYTPRNDFSEKDVWAWTDVFMPDNERRRKMQAALMSCGLVVGTGSSLKSQPQLDPPILATAGVILSEACTAYNDVNFYKHRNNFEAALGVRQETEVRGGVLTRANYTA